MKKWATVGFLICVGITSVHAQKQQTISVSTGYSHWLNRDELQSIRNFYGGSMAFGAGYLRSTAVREFGMGVFYQRASFVSRTSAMTSKQQMGWVDFYWLRSIGSIESSEVKTGIKLRNYFGTRTYRFNSPFAGEEPFTGEFFVSPALSVSANRHIWDNYQLSWAVDFSPLAYLLSRGYHPIRGYSSFAELPKGMVLVPDFLDLESSLTLRRPVSGSFDVSLSYHWRYLQYSRDYRFQAGNHRLVLGINFKKGK